MDRSVSDAFFDVIRQSHTIASYMDIVSATGQKVRLDITAGEVKVDRTAAVRRTCTLTAIDRTGTLTPTSASDLFAPNGAEIFPYRGVTYTNLAGQVVTEVVPLGIFRVSKVTVNDTVQGLSMDVEGFDRSRVVMRDKFTSPITVNAGTNIIDVIKSILAYTFDNLTYDVLGTSRTTPATQVYDVGTDPWQLCTDLATSLGCDVYFDTRGTVVIAPPTDIQALPTPVFVYAEGQNCTLIDISRVFTDEPGYNGVVVTGESPATTAAPVRAIAWDTEPSSSTYHLGPYGEVPMFYTDQLITTVQDAQNTANQLLNNILGFQSQLTINAVVNPALEAGDAVQVVRARSHINDLFSIDAFNIPLDAATPQNLILRQKRRVA